MPARAQAWHQTNSSADAIHERQKSLKNPTRLAELQRDYAANTAELDLLYRAYDRRISQ
jgi:hypothetical protein